MLIRTIGFPVTLTRLFGFSSLEYWCWYSYGCVRARSLGTAAQIKKKGEPLLVFTGLWFNISAIIFWLASGKYKIVS
jgi:hypothetical protein